MTHKDATYVGELDVGRHIGQLVVMRLLLWSPYVIGQTIKLIFCPVISIFLLVSSFFFSSPNLSGRRLDVYHISTHAVALVRI